ncbi:zf-HC2 domain-containing protein [Streptomyces cupreus]|uniref:Zf-HC2 domain-containing protein n=1 Tax=Streptomyces cupreus TaxID=2759956 RepID=A0A7X1J5Y0_9ACTN|nr:zf-HC2 domain-containing protein [Streptomyces cupreus]MBC2903752.1 zf-HC2 domain-containing protein [Streptomyces cupreus]
MRSLERHRDVAAYALGVLDEADAFRFEDHLMECPSCAAHVTEFGPATRQLMLYRRATPRFVHPMAKPGPRLLDRLLGEVAVRNRTGRRRLLFGLAASAAVALAAPGIAMMAKDGDSTARRIEATDERSGVWAQVTAENEPWGTQVELKVKDGAGPRACRLIAIGRDGSEQMITSWTVAHHDARENTMMGAAAFHADEIDHYEVRTAAGEHLVTLGPS